MSRLDDTVYYTVLGMCHDIDIYDVDELDNVECRLSVEVTYWSVCGYPERVRVLNKILLDVKNKLADLIILEYK